MRDKFIAFLQRRETNIIIGIAIIILVCLALSSCKKESKEPLIEKTQPKCVDINLAKDVIWHPIYSGHDYHTLKSNGDYYENGIYRGVYSFDGCNLISVSNSTNTAYNFNFRIERLTADTMKVITARFGVTLFYK